MKIILFLKMSNGFITYCLWHPPHPSFFSCNNVTRAILKLGSRSDDIWSPPAGSRGGLVKNKWFDQNSRTKLQIFWHLIPSAAVEIYWKGSPSNAFVRMLIGKNDFMVWLIRSPLWTSLDLNEHTQVQGHQSGSTICWEGSVFRLTANCNHPQPKESG